MKGIKAIAAVLFFAWLLIYLGGTACMAANPLNCCGYDDSHCFVQTFYAEPGNSQTKSTVSLVQADDSLVVSRPIIGIEGGQAKPLTIACCPPPGQNLEIKNTHPTNAPPGV